MQDKKDQRLKLMEMIPQWQKSGLTQKEFCATNNIAYHVFHYWYGVYRTKQKSTDSFIPVKIRPALNNEPIILTGTSGLEVRLPFTDHSIRFIKQLLLS
jgi:hypothetical protein